MPRNSSSEDTIAPRDLEDGSNADRPKNADHEKREWDNNVVRYSPPPDIRRAIDRGWVIGVMGGRS
jgi:hypothetical protein